MYQLNKGEQKLGAAIENSFYMGPTLERVHAFIAQQNNTAKAWQEVFNQLYTILVESKEDVAAILHTRKAKGEIKDIRQSMKSIAGHTFSSAIVYVFLQNKVIGNIKPAIFITSKQSQVKNFSSIAVIHVDGEAQKPDCDLIIFTKKENGDVHRCMLLSLKTSLRERAGQTYKWKLLMEIATSENAIKKKYGIAYNPAKMPLVCFATVNFYDEINNPQHRGMCKFFDKSFIAKPIDKDFISSLAHLVDFVNQTLCSTK